MQFRADGIDIEGSLKGRQPRNGVFTETCQNVRGSVRLTASEVIGVEVLPPILAKLRPYDHWL
jgi:hypothetical protein